MPITNETPPDADLVQAQGQALLTMPKMLLRAALSAGCDVVITARIGAPDSAAELIEGQRAWLAEQGVEALVMPDSVHALAAARGAVVAGRRGLLLLDATSVPEAGWLSLGGGEEPDDTRGAVVLVAGPVDSPAGRRACDAWVAGGVAVFEPALHEEVMPWFGVALQAAGLAGGWSAFGLARELWDGFATVACGPVGGRSSSSGVSATRPAEQVQGERLVVLAREQSINTIVNPPGRDEALPLGLIAGGVGYARLRQVVSELGLIGRLPILRLGMAGPLDAELLSRHARDCRALWVVDHREGGLYRRVAAALDRRTGEPVQTKLGALLASAEASPGAVLLGLAPHLRGHPAVPREVLDGALEALQRQVRAVTEGTDDTMRDVLPPPGSPLVDVAAVLGRLRRDLTDAQYMSEQHGRGPMDLSVYGALDDQSRALIADEGSPVAETLVPGTVAGGAAHGAGAREDRRPVVVMSGRDFFANGYAAIANASRGARDITFIIHTEDPTTLRKRKRRRRRFRRRPAPGVLDVQAMLAALSADGIHHGISIGEIDPTDRPRLRRLLERSLVGRGVHVVLARRRFGPRALAEAALESRREWIEHSYIPTQQHLVLCPEVWPLSQAQRLHLGPLGLEPAPGETGGWMTSTSWGWAGKPMLKTLANPSLGLATVTRTGPERSRLDESELAGLPAPPRPQHADQEVWRASVAGVSLAGMDLLLDLLTESGTAMGYQVRGSRTDTLSLASTGGRADVVFSSRPREQELTVAGSPGRSTRALSSSVPTPGSTDLVLGTDARESASALLAVGGPGRTSAVVDTTALPTLAELKAGRPAANTDALRRALRDRARPGAGIALPAGELSEYLWGHRRFAAWVMMGTALQLGLVPLNIQAIDAATRRVLGRNDPRCSEAIDVGRKLAVDPGFADRCLLVDDAGPVALLDSVTEDLAQQYGGRSGPSVSREFHGMVAPLLDRCAPMDVAIRTRLVHAAHRCAVWGGKRNGVAYARRYCEAIGLLLDHDRAERSYELTRRGIDSAARVMIVPDEVYLASLLTSPSRYRRDRRRLNVALERGDKVSYLHVVRPEFDLFKRHIAFTLTLGERSLRLLARLHVVRRVRAGWYREQRGLRDLYLQTLAGVSDTADLSDYRKWCAIASSTARIAGRGEARRQAVREARARLDRLVAVDAKQLSNE